MQVLKVNHASLLCGVVSKHTIEAFAVGHDAAEDGQAGTTRFVQHQFDGIIRSLPGTHVVVPDVDATLIHKYDTLLINQMLEQSFRPVSLLFQHGQVCLPGEDPVLDPQILDAVVNIELAEKRRRDFDCVVSVLIEFHRTLLQTQSLPQFQRRS